MSDFQSLLTTGYSDMKTRAGVTIAKADGTLSRKIVGSAMMSKTQLQQAGYLPEIDVVIEISPADIAALGIVERGEFLVSGRLVRAMPFDTHESRPHVTISCIHAR